MVTVTDNIGHPWGRPDLCIYFWMVVFGCDRGNYALAILFTYICSFPYMVCALLSPSLLILTFVYNSNPRGSQRALAPPLRCGITQIRGGHIASSCPPSPVRYMPCIFIAGKAQPFFPSSIRVELRLPTLYRRSRHFCEKISWHAHYVIPDARSAARSHPLLVLVSNKSKRAHYRLFGLLFCNQNES